MQVLAPPAQPQLARYAADGFLAWGPLLAAEELEVLRAEYDRVLAEALDAKTFSDLAGGAHAMPGASADGGSAPERGQMIQIMQMCERSLAFRRLIADERILGVVRELIGPNLMLFHDQALYKPPQSGGQNSWHQDNGYWACRPAHLLSCWITLDDAWRENGAMQLVPGSHLQSIGHATDHHSDRLLSVPDPCPEQVVVVDLPAGGCLFHHCQTLHYTAPNTTAHPRRAFTIHYMPPGTRDRNGQIIHTDWAHPVLSLSM